MKCISFLLCRISCLLICIASITCVQAQSKQAAQVAAIQNPVAKLSYKIINGVNGTFGYEIYRSGKMIIRQLSVPALPGNEGFTTRAAAEKVAQLAVKKMAAGESLPTISIGEMKKLKAI